MSIDNCHNCGADLSDDWDEDYEPQPEPSWFARKWNRLLIKLHIRKPATVSMFDALLKEYYLPAVREELNSQSMLYTQLTKPEKKVKSILVGRSVPFNYEPEKP